MLGSTPVTATLPAEDLNRAIQFYTQTLGLKQVDLGIPADQAPGVLFEAGNGTQIFIYTRGRSTAQHTALTFMVADI